MGLMNNYFGPLGEDYCVYFYALSIFFGIGFAISLISVISFIVFNHKKVNSTFIINTIIILLNAFFLYLSNRLLHTMCVKAL